MLDLKVLNAALAQLEEEKGIPREKILGAIEDALAAAYKKDYGKRGQIIKAKFDLATGAVNFFRIKIVVDDDMILKEGDEVPTDGEGEEDDRKMYFNEEHHIMLADAKKIRKDAVVDDEIAFPLETKDDYGRIAAQTAKQVIIQRLREAEKVSVLEEFTKKQGEIISGSVQRVERGNVFIDLGRITAVLTRENQIPGEYYRQGERIKAILLSVEETSRGVELRLSRAAPALLAKLFEVESPEIANGSVVIEAIAREAGSRSKIAVSSRDENIDPVGSLVGQRGVRVNTVINELGGEKIDIVEWSDNTETFIIKALSPARVLGVTTDEETRTAKVNVDADQFSLAIGRGGQNVRLAAKLTGWKIDISAPTGETMSESPEEKLMESGSEKALSKDGSESGTAEEKAGESSEEAEAREEK